MASEHNSDCLGRSERKATDKSIDLLLRNMPLPEGFEEEETVSADTLSARTAWLENNFRRLLDSAEKTHKDNALTRRQIVWIMKVLKDLHLRLRTTDNTMVAVMPFPLTDDDVEFPRNTRGRPTHTKLDFLKNSTQLKSWLRGSYKSTLTVCIIIALMGLALLVIGCSLTLPHELKYFPLEYYRTCVLGAGILLQGIMFLVWSLMSTGSTICFKSVQKAGRNAPKSKRTSLVRRWRICTMVASILLALTGFTMVIVGMILLQIEPRGVYYCIDYPCKKDRPPDFPQLIPYATGVMLIVLAVNFFVLSAILAVCAHYLRKARKGELVAPPESGDPPPYV